MDAASASAAAEALEATLQADLVGLRAQLRTDVLDEDGIQDGRPDVVEVRDVGEVEAVRSADEIHAQIAALNARIEAELLIEQDARERSHATAVAEAGPHRRRRRRP